MQLATADAQALLSSLSAISDKLDRIREVLMGDPSRSGVLTYPGAGGYRAVPNGTTVFDLLNGAVSRPDVGEQMSAGLNSIGLPYAQSVLLYVDAQAVAEGFYQGRSMGKFGIDQGSQQILAGLPIDKLAITSSYSYDMKAKFVASPIPPVAPPALAGFMERYGSGTTVDSFTPVPMGPTQGGALAATYLQDNLPVQQMGDRIYVVQNTGSNSMDLNVQNLLVSGQTWADNSTTGASLALGAGLMAVIETGLPSAYIRIRVRSTTAGSRTTFTVQFNGFTTPR